MGNSYIAFDAFISAFGWESVIPDFPNKKTIMLGSKYSPEFICFPFKVNVGDFINALEKGAKTLAMINGVGPCRFNYYGEQQERILKSLGYDFDMIMFNQISLSKVFTRLKEIFGEKEFWARIRSAIRALVSKSKSVYIIEKLAAETRCYERVKGETTRVMNRCLKLVKDSKTLEEMKKARKMIYENFSQIDVDTSKNPIKIAIVGEIYMVLEKNVNFNIEERLGEMGVYMFRPLSLYEWLKYLVRLDFKDKKIRAMAKPYLKYPTAGKDQHSIGYAIKCAQDGFDGIIHIYPFTCMPQLIARSAFESVARDYDIPILNLPIDEHSGEAGFLTRIEAFVDLLERRRMKKYYNHSSNFKYNISSK